MSSAVTEFYASEAIERRKVRKGTRSCWECKRRKIRCIFASPEAATCIGCQRRRAPCVTQELPEELAPEKKGNRHLSDRIAKVEDFVKAYLASKDAAGQPFGQQTRHDTLPSQDQASYLTPLSARTPLDDDHETETARRHLWEALPPEEDIRILLQESSIPALYTEMVTTQPVSQLTRFSLGPAAYPRPELPDKDAHPVMLAKMMLFFAITLESPTGKNIVGLSQPAVEMKHRLVAAATRWVTTNPDMHKSLDCLICIMLEGVYGINSGNLRISWAAHRRAMTVAQLLGLHRSPMPNNIQRIDPELNADPEALWFRIVYMDRYLSLLLGLPQGTTDTNILSHSVMQNEPPLGVFERNLTVIASRILERNESPFATSDFTTTATIDSELLALSKSMPASFWRPAFFHKLTLGAPDTLIESLRLSAQVYYYGLLIQLHLPYMLTTGSNTGQGYSKLTCVNASREIMTRFIAHRTFNPVSSCSRPVDFFALLAGMTLLLALLDAHHNPEAASFLAHQRFSDRAMLDQALERMDVITDVNKDPVTEKSAALIRRLMEIEADAAEGNSYTTKSVIGGVDMGESSRDGRVDLLLHIPYLGVIEISRRGPVAREPPPQREQADDSNGPFTFPPHSPADEQMLSHLAVSSQTLNGYLSTPGFGHPVLQRPSQDHVSGPSQEAAHPAMTADANDWTFQGVDVAFFDGLMRGMPGIDPALEQQWIEEHTQMEDDG
ncbi:C6 zinc finger domain protein [Coniochaeta sp. 2T2.1]|nr:C6 zinc finger domain protein [Coniochaeta sp. 2T2.1]